MQGTENSRRLVVEDALNRIRSAGVPAGRKEVEWLLQAVEGLTRAGFVAALSAPPSPDALQRFERMVLRRMSHEPVQYILGEAEFYGRIFEVTPTVLIPRPETEVLVERIIAAIDDMAAAGGLVAGESVAGGASGAADGASTGTKRPRVLDAGTGSGCIAVTLALECSRARCTAFDISREALLVARSNALRLGADVRFAEWDMLADPPDAWLGAFDLLVSNPPYVPDSEKNDLERQVADFEPAVALFTGEDVLTFYRGLARLGQAVLAPGGRLFVETHMDFAADVREVLEKAGYVGVVVERDLSGRDRIVTARLS